MLFSGEDDVVDVIDEQMWGQFKDDKMTGQGVFTGPTGDRYEKRCS